MALKKFTDEYFMQCCLDLAENGLGKTYPNPIVGSIIVYKDRIIGKGWHEKQVSTMLKLKLFLM